MSCGKSVASRWVTGLKGHILRRAWVACCGKSLVGGPPNPISSVRNKNPNKASRTLFVNSRETHSIGHQKVEEALLAIRV